MGGTTSVQLPYIKEFESKEGTKAIMNTMLKYMMENLTIKEFASLSDPATCKSYVLLKANLLSKYFYELRILPVTDGKTGIISFRKAKDLTDLPSGSKAEQEKQSLCLILSYYYTRIFQIYGALALTLIEDVKSFSTYAYAPSDRFIAPGYDVRQVPLMHGGAFDQTSAGDFFVLSSFIASGTPNLYGYVTEYKGSTTDNKATIRFLKKDKDAEGRTDVHGEFTIFPEGSSQIGTLFIRASQVPGTTEIKLKIEKLQYMQKSERKEDSLSFLSEKTISIDTSKNVPSIKGSSKSILDYFTDLFEKIVPHLKKQLGVAVSTGPVVERIEHLGHSSVDMNLVRDRPLGHCVARAMQLLKSPIFESDATESYVCKAKFIGKPNEKGEIVMWDGGLPDVGDKITSSPAIRALDDLFYDTIVFHSPKLGLSQASAVQYKLFKERMSQIFEGTSQEKDVNTIRSTKDREGCTTTDPILLKGDKRSAVLGVYNALLRRQRIHAVNCGKILVKLFQISVLPSSIKIALNDNVIRQGFPAIAKINQEARQVLIEYYSECEAMYLKGRDMIIGTATTATTATATAAAAAKPQAQQTQPVAVPVAPQKPVAMTVTPQKPVAAQKPSSIPSSIFWSDNKK